MIKFFDHYSVTHHIVSIILAVAATKDHIRTTAIIIIRVVIIEKNHIVSLAPEAFLANAVEKKMGAVS